MSSNPIDIVYESARWEQVDEELRVKTAQLAAVTQAMTAFISSGNWRESSSLILQNALTQTESEYGFVGVLFEGPVLRILSHEGVIWDSHINHEFYENALCSYHQRGYLEFTNFDNLFGEVITTGQVVISNDPASDARSGGLPPGHPPLRHFLGVPIVKGSEVIGLIGVANRLGGYTGSEQARIEILSQSASVIYDSYRRQEREAALNRERERAENRLRQAVAWQEAIFEGSRDAIFITDAEGGFTAVNAAACEMTGYSKEELLGMRISDLHKETDLIAFQSYHQRIINGEEILSEAKILRKDGRKVDTEFNNCRVIIEGAPYMHTTARDITERKRTEDALKESEERYRLYFEENLAGAVISNPEGKILACNSAFAHIFGFDSIEEATEQNIASFYLNPEDRKEFRALLRKHGRLEYHEIELRHKDGTRLNVIENIVGVFDEQGELTEIRGYLLDDTGRKKAEEKFRQAQKMEAVGRLAGGVAHDFNNLLTAITGYSELIIAKTPRADRSHGMLVEILKAANRAAALTNQLLAFSRNQILQPKVLDLNELVASIGKMLRRLIGEDIDLITILNPTVKCVKADLGQLEQVIMNLAVNARDAMPDGGKLIIETANVYFNREHVHRDVAIEPGSYVMLAVSDEGCGMDAETQAHIFEPFFSTKEQGKGTGLGLSTTYGIVKQSGGYIWVYSKPGQGSTFKVYLPTVEEAPDSEESSQQYVYVRGSETVLIAEDEESVRTLIARVLSEYGYRVIEASTGEEALEIASRHEGEKIELLITDVVMPGMSGRGLADQFQMLLPETKVLFISGYTSDAIVYKGVLDEGVLFLQKPFTPNELLRKVREIIKE